MGAGNKVTTQLLLYLSLNNGISENEKYVNKYIGTLSFLNAYETCTRPFSVNGMYHIFSGIFDS